VNGKLGAYHAAHFAANAFTTVVHADNMIPFAVGLVTFIQQVLRAKLNTEAAALAPFCHHKDPVLFGFYYAVAQ
jgi:hypothetical protein